LENLLALLPAIPFVSAVLIFLLPQAWQKHSAHISVLSLSVTFLVSIFCLLEILAGVEPVTLSLGAGWGMLMLDPLSTLMSLVITAISLIVHVYSVRYMADEEGYTRFYVLLGLMTASLLLMVTAGDLITLLIAWHLIGVLLYFLLGHNTVDQPTQRYAMWTLITYRLGDLPLVLAAVLLFDSYGTWSLTELFTRISEQPSATTLGGLPVIETAGLLIAFSAFARSAQFILHSWLPYTMSGPTPVSALMHAGIVNAGGFLVNRFAPLFMHSSDVLHVMFVVGLVTAVIGSMLMLTQNDIKKALGYSTMGQMGFMIMECGVGAFSLAVFHLIAHGLFKGTLFLSAGGVISEARKSDGIPKNEVYTFVVERQMESRRQPWMLMAALTLALPLMILYLTHWSVANDYFQKQGAIVLLFFGWVTGAQLIFASYKMQTSSPWKLFLKMLVSLVVVVLGYTLISHAFEVFLYPDPAANELLYQASSVDFFWFAVFVIPVTISIILGWVLVYHAEQSATRGGWQKVLWQNFYAVVAREFYVLEAFSALTRYLLAFAARLNRWLRWA